MYLTLGTASKETGKAKSTILRAIREGRLSYAEKNQKGYQIDPAELFRVFPRNVPENVPSNDPQLAKEQGATTEQFMRIAELEARLEIALKLNDEFRENAKQWHQEANHWRQQATALLEDKRGKENHGLIARLLKRS